MLTQSPLHSLPDLPPLFSGKARAAIDCVAMSIHVCRIVVDRSQPQLHRVVPLALRLQPLRPDAKSWSFAGRCALAFGKIAIDAPRDPWLLSRAGGLIVPQRAKR